MTKTKITLNVISIEDSRMLQKVAAIDRGGWDFNTYREFMAEKSTLGWAGVDNNNIVLAYAMTRVKKTNLRIVNFGVRETMEKYGIGCVMIDALQSLTTAMEKDKLIIDVDENDLKLQLFLKRNYFFGEIFDGGFYRFTWPANLNRAIHDF